MIDLWFDRIAHRYEPAMLDSLSSREVERALRFRSPAARARYVVAHHWLHVRLGELLDVAPADVPLQVDAGRAPVLDADSGHVSFSHHQTHVALAVSADEAVGIDVLELPEHARFVGDTGLVLSPSEIELVRSTSSRRQPAVFAHCWSRKEAYGKLLGTGLTADLARITLTPRAPSHRAASFRSYELPDAVVAVATVAPTVPRVRRHPG